MSSVDPTNELRLAKPRAPEQLRERVMALGERPVREPRFSFSLPFRYTARRVALVAAPAIVALAVGGAAIHGIANSGAPNQQAARGEADQSTTTVTFSAPAPARPGVFGAKTLSSGRGRIGAPFAPQALAPSANRLQDYHASLVVRVDGLDELSAATQKAMRVTRALGGYIVGARTSQAKQGSSSLVVRIPIARVQDAIAKFSELGTIAAQNIQITDLQAQFNRLVKRIGDLRVAIAKVDDKLADTSLSSAARVRLEQQRARLAARLEALRTSRAHTAHRAALASVSLGLTTKKAAAVVKPEHRGPLGRALHDAGNILAKEASWGLYALIVLGPILLIALLAWLLVRGGRRLSDRRLLESS